MTEYEKCEMKAMGKSFLDGALILLAAAGICAVVWFGFLRDIQ